MVFGWRDLGKVDDGTDKRSGSFLDSEGEKAQSGQVHLIFTGRLQQGRPLTDIYSESYGGFSSQQPLHWQSGPLPVSYHAASRLHIKIGRSPHRLHGRNETRAVASTAIFQLQVHAGLSV